MAQRSYKSLEEAALNWGSQPGSKPYLGPVIGVDPGETTGFALINNAKLVKWDQIETDTPLKAWYNLGKIFEETKHQFPEGVDVACEDYRIYSWKSKDHSWSAVHTIKVVGYVQILAHTHGFNLKMRMAQQAKAFMSDKRLEEWGLYQEGQRHARDAIKHAAFHVLFSTLHPIKGQKATFEVIDDVYTP
jgi:hypothetical protein